MSPVTVAEGKSDVCRTILDNFQGENVMAKKAIKVCSNTTVFSPPDAYELILWFFKPLSSFTHLGIKVRGTKSLDFTNPFQMNKSDSSGFRFPHELWSALISTSLPMLWPDALPRVLLCRPRMLSSIGPNMWGAERQRTTAGAQLAAFCVDKDAGRL